MLQIDKRAENDILTEKIIGAAIQVHKELGPGLLESLIFLTVRPVRNNMRTVRGSLFSLQFNQY